MAKKNISPCRETVGDRPMSWDSGLYSDAEYARLWQMVKSHKSRMKPLHIINLMKGNGNVQPWAKRVRKDTGEKKPLGETLEESGTVGMGNTPSCVM